MARPLAALLCLLALLAPAGAAFARGLATSACVDSCCAESGCAPAPEAGEPDQGDDCPPGCPDCACSARARLATPAGGTVAEPATDEREAAVAEPRLLALDADPREILHVPRG